MAALLNDTSSWPLSAVSSSSSWLQSTGHFLSADLKLPSVWISRDAVPFVSSLVLAYLLLVKALRFRRINKLQQRSASLASMTDEEAWEIQRAMAQLEFPTLFEKSLQFALFRVSATKLVTFFIFTFSLYLFFFLFFLSTGLTK